MIGICGHIPGVTCSNCRSTQKEPTMEELNLLREQLKQRDRADMMEASQEGNEHG